MKNLNDIAEKIHAELEETNAIRDRTLAASRMLIRHCSETIRAVHRKEWHQAEAGLATTREAAMEMVKAVENHPDLYHTGFTQDALKEYVEAFTLYALVKDEDLPTPESLNVPGATYLNGLAEAASELRRKILDIIRFEHSSQAEEYLDAMDAIYSLIMTFDFPDAVTYGLRRRSDALRAVLERTRGDMTTSLRQQELYIALNMMHERLGDMLELDTLDFTREHDDPDSPDFDDEESQL